MTFKFTPEELSYIAESFGYAHFEKIEHVPFDHSACTNSLLEKGYISSYKKGYELSNSVRLLFSAWIGNRYTLVRTDYLSANHIFALHASSKSIFSFSLHDGHIQISLCDFSAGVMDKILADYLELTQINDICSPFNISFTGSEFAEFFIQNASSSQISKSTGLSVKDIDLIKASLTKEDNLSFILKDEELKINCLGIIKKQENTYIMIKYISPDASPEHQKVVVVKGNMGDIIDSVYVI